VAVAWRATALDAMTALWRSTTRVLSTRSCALRYQRYEVVGLIPWELGGSTGHMDALVKVWHRQVTAEVGPVSAGRSSVYAGRSGTAQALGEAISAMDLGDRARGPGRLTAYGEIFVLDYAARLMNDHRLGGLYDRVPSRLRTADETGRAGLLSTLEAFLTEGSVIGTAAQLGIHRNTVLYRLKRIEELTGINLEDPEIRFLVHLALRAHRRLAMETG
jgi:sugar diacid utilization regulator